MPAKADAVVVNLPDDIKDQIDTIAEATNRSASAVIADAVSLYVHGRAVYEREMDAALASAKSGTGHSAEQVFRWMDDWAAGTKNPLPKPDLVPQK